MNAKKKKKKETASNSQFDSTQQRFSFLSYFFSVAVVVIIPSRHNSLAHAIFGSIQFSRSDFQKFPNLLNPFFGLVIVVFIQTTCKNFLNVFNFRHNAKGKTPSSNKCKIKHLVRHTRKRNIALTHSHMPTMRHPTNIILRKVIKKPTWKDKCVEKISSFLRTKLENQPTIKTTAAAATLMYTHAHLHI